MTDPSQIVAEMRAGELRLALLAAVNGHSHWRMNANQLLREINELVLPPLATEALREIDARKRAAEIMSDACSG